MPHAIIDPRKVVVKLATILDKVEIPYFITGGFAVSVWGRPRATFDIDIVVELVEPKVEALAKALRKVYKAGYIDEISARDAIRNKSEFNFIDPFTGVKIDFWVLKTSDTFDESRIKRRVSRKILGKTVYFTSPEDLILIKLLWSKDSQSTRQLEDVESIYKISGKKLDMKYVRKWARRLKVADTLRDVTKRK